VISTSAERAGLSVIATLQSGTLPGWYSEDTPGHRDERGREYLWARQVDRCAERWGDRVAIWVPIDDPVGWAIRGFSAREADRRDGATPRPARWRSRVHCWPTTRRTAAPGVG
jgi:hypothetical protein